MYEEQSPIDYGDFDLSVRDVNPHWTMLLDRINIGVPGESCLFRLSKVV